MACNSEQDDTEPLDCETSTLTYENYGQPYLLTWCVPCHSSELTEEERQDAPLDANYETLQGVLDHLDKIEVLAVNSDEMPPVGGPEEEEQELFGEWILCGAP